MTNSVSLNLVQRIWRFAKVGARIPVGPLALHWRLARAVSVSPNPRRGPAAGASTIACVQSSSEADDAGMDSPSAAVLRSEGISSGAGVALIVGAGPGLGSALARRFSRAGMAVAVASRNAKKMDGLVGELVASGGSARRYGCDATDERSVKSMLERVVEEMGIPDLVVYNVEHFIPGTLLDIETSAFEECWRAMALGGFIVGRETARRMVPRGSGTIIYTGATAALRGRAEYINMAVGKFGVRALAQSMARDLGPKGIHVAHVILDGGILPPGSNDEAQSGERCMRPEHIAETYMQLHLQPRSTWTQELDLRPWVERF